MTLDSGATALPESDPEIDAFVLAFEAGSLPKARWTHAAHILTGACYVHAYGEAAAIDRMRSGVSAYNLAVGGQNTPSSGYHETVTVFWIKLIAQVLSNTAATNPGMPRGELVRLTVESLVNQPNIYREFYDFDILASQEARRIWMEPNLRPL